MLIPYAICLLLNILDFLTGIILAVKNKKFKPSVARNGIFKKSAYIILYILGTILTYYGKYIGFTDTTAITILIATNVSIAEVSSIVKNIGKINSKIVPNKIMNIFEEVKK